MGTFSGVMQAAVDSNTVSAVGIAALVKDGDVVLARELTWQKAIGALGLTRCPFWTPDPPSVPRTLAPPTAPATPPTAPATPPPGTAPSLTLGELQLADRLNSNDLTNCVGLPDLETGGVVAAVNCQSVQFGPTKRPLVVQFADVGSAQTWFQNSTSGFANNNDCAGGQELGTWDHDGFLAGPWGCGYVNGNLHMVWVADTSLIGVVADGSNGPALYSWWTNWGYVLSSPG